MLARPSTSEWLCALGVALILHAVVLSALQHRPPSPKEVTARRAGANVIHVSTRQIQPPVRPTPVPPTANPSPAAPSPTAALTPTPVPRAAPSRVSPTSVASRLPATAPTPPAETPQAPEKNEPPSEAYADRPTQWLDANQADSAPAPHDNTWTLANRPWPARFASVQLKVWVSAQGRIERFELEGTAADDPAMRELFTPFVNTPMQPARIGHVPVPSVMRIELWIGDDGVPEFIGPLTADAPPVHLRY